MWNQLTFTSFTELFVITAVVVTVGWSRELKIALRLKVRSYIRRTEVSARSHEGDASGYAAWCENVPGQSTPVRIIRIRSFSCNSASHGARILSELLGRSDHQDSKCGRGGRTIDTQRAKLSPPPELWVSHCHSPPCQSSTAPAPSC